MPKRDDVSQYKTQADRGRSNAVMEELKQLKELYDQELIDEDEYKEQKKIILSQLTSKARPPRAARRRIWGRVLPAVNWTRGRSWAGTTKS